MFEWKEHEHERDDVVALRDQNTITALRNCGLLKFFKIQNMRKELMLLEHLIQMWDPNEKVFKVGPHDLEIEVEDIYFLTGAFKTRCPCFFGWDQSY
jgi:hypothetical protein